MRFHHYFSVGAALLTMLVAREAAAVTCDNAGLGPTPILYIENGDTQEPLLKRIGEELLNSATPVRIVYRNRPTCDLATNWYTAGERTLGPVSGTTLRPVAYIPDGTFDITTAAPQCDLPATPPAIQLAIGATFLTSCPALPTMPTDTTLLPGPNQAYGFVTNPMSTQVAITAEEGYLAYGFVDDGGGAAPWLTQALRLTRGSTASTTLTSAANIGLTPAQMLVGSQLPTTGTSTTPVGAGNSGLIVTGISGATANPDASIGALGGDLYDANRNILKLLAFKGFQQRYGYYPDFSSTTFDKINVRDGHYLIWSPTQYIFAKDTVTAGANPNTPVDPEVLRFVNLIFGYTIEADVNGLDSVAKSGLIPQCAMKVSRPFDGGDLSLYSDPAPCGCYFESAVPSGSSSCTTCTGADNTPCTGGGTCRHGYCEAK